MEKAKKYNKIYIVQIGTSGFSYFLETPKTKDEAIQYAYKANKGLNDGDITAIESDEDLQLFVNYGTSHPYILYVFWDK